MKTPSSGKLLRALCVCGLLLAACDKSGNSFSMLPASESFGQSVYAVNNKIDVLWVVDNSGSMMPLQTNLVKNFNTFIKTFQNKGYDFHIAVTSTDAYLANTLQLNNPALSKWKDGGTTHTGISVIDNNTTNLVNTFVTNASLGDQGDGDERAFSSFQESLNNPANSAFRRADAFLAIIILSDEDDFSGNKRPEGVGTDHNYNATTLDTVDSYVSYLDNLTSSTAADRRPFRRRQAAPAVRVAHRVG